MNLRDIKEGDLLYLQQVEALVVEANDYSWHTGTGEGALGECLVFHSDGAFMGSPDGNEAGYVVSFCCVSIDVQPGTEYRCVFTNAQSDASLLEESNH